MRIKVPIHYRKVDQRVEFHCPFCNQSQGWNAEVQSGENGEVSPTPMVVFTRHLFGDSDVAGGCFVRPSVDEVAEYEPVATVED